MKKHLGPNVVGALIDESVRLDSHIGHVDWASMPAGFQRWTFNAPSGPLAAISVGAESAPVIVLLPGLTGSKEDFILMMEKLHPMGYRCVSIDLAGQYESSVTALFEPRPYKWNLFVEDVEALLRFVGPAHLVGLSFAGQVAQLVAATNVEGVRSLTLISAPPGSGAVFSCVKRGGSFSKFIPNPVKAFAMRVALKLNVIRAPKDRATFVAHRVPFHSQKSLRDVFSMMDDSPELNCSMAALSIPKLVVTGTHDLWPVELHRSYATQIGADFAVYQTGHSPCETVPNQLVRDMARFILHRND